jgi:hypothetical protein
VRAVASLNGPNASLVWKPLFEAGDQLFQTRESCDVAEVGDRHPQSGAVRATFFGKDDVLLAEAPQ